jgi:predicted AAA+ superfamily ATPase
MIAPPLHPRFASASLSLALTDTPVVLIHGPRQCGKTTLARQVGEPLGYTYLSFDDPVVLAVAKDDPAGFVADLPEKVILDEVQKAPALFSAIKLSVDRNRKPGRFLLTGSANVLLVPKLSDSLAGRFVLQELRRQADWGQKTTRFFHYRDKDQVEVDVVAERGASAVAGIEVKASGTVTASDFTGLRRLREVAGSRFKAGVVLYDGETCLGFGDRLFAVPVRTLWEKAQMGGLS